MNNIWLIFKRDLRKIATNSMAIILAAGVLVLPSLYAWVNIYANWDPYGKQSTGNMKIAVMIEDQGISFRDIDINIGDQIEENLKANDVMKLHTIEKILSANMSLGYWFNSYTPEKPVLIVTQGILLTSYLTEKFRIWQDYFSIFTIEPTDEHDQYIFQDATFSEVIEMYYTVLDLMIPADANIFGFLGYSWGGVQAYHLACKWRDVNGGVSLPVWLGDSHLRNDEHTEKQMQEYERQIERVVPEILKKKHQMIKRLEDNAEYPHYDGKVVLFNAKKLNPLEEYNLAEWRKIASQLEIIDFDDEHNNLFMTENYNDMVTESLLKELNSDK